jgi:hypothetical protein
MLFAVGRMPLLCRPGWLTLDYGLIARGAIWAGD